MKKFKETNDHATEEIAIAIEIVIVIVRGVTIVIAIAIGIGREIRGTGIASAGIERIVVIVRTRIPRKFVLRKNLWMVYFIYVL